MRTSFARLFAFGLLATCSQAHAFSIPLSGSEVDGANIIVISFMNTDPDAVSSLTFDFTYVSVSPSWSEELVMQISHVPSGTSLLAGSLLAGTDYCSALFGATCDIDLGGLDNSEPLLVDDLATSVSIADGSGLWTVSIGDGFDDAGNITGLDGVFDDGSEIRVDSTTVVPLPAAVWLYASALLGLARLSRPA